MVLTPMSDQNNTKNPEIYLDYHATTPVDARVVEAMLPFLTEIFGNPASTNHSYGWMAEAAVAKAREQVANLIGAQEKEILFTSGATESINLAILGLLKNYAPNKAHLITSNVEHSATLQVAKAAEKLGYAVTWLAADRHGQIRADQVKEALTDETVLVSLLFANNEIGTINPVEEIGAVLADRKILFHVDAVQAVGRCPIDVARMGIHLLSLSAHKIYGPKGVGALYARAKNPRVRLSPIFFGGGQENGIRPGTMNVPGAVGLGKSCEIMDLECKSENSRLAGIRDKLWGILKARVPGAQVNGHPTQRLPNNLNVTVPGVYADLFQANLKGLAVSRGSACATGGTAGSHVLRAIGVDPELSRTTLRFGLGRPTTEEEVERAAEIVVNAYGKSRK